MNVWAIVPVKPFKRAKSRLSDTLSPEQRENLAIGLLERTVRLLVPLTCIQGVLVISRDPKALSMAREWGAQTVQESGAPELNRALLRATQALKVWGAEAALVVPADIPLLNADDIEAMVMMGHYHNSVVLAPDRHQHGTNLLLVRPPGLIPYSFGDDSYAEHQRLAHEVQATVMTYNSERARLDIDLPDDLRQYHALAKVFEESIIKIGESGELLLTGDSHRNR